MSVAFLHLSGRQIVSGSQDINPFQIWNVEDIPTYIRAIYPKIHTDGVRSVAFSPDGKRAELYQAQVIRPFMFGMHRQGAWFQDHSRDIQVQSHLLPSHQMADIFSLAQKIRLYICGMWRLAAL